MASTASAVGENRIAASFTPREVEVLFLCARGFSDREIAAELSISVFTVGSHMRRVLRKSGSASRTEAVARAYEAGLLGEMQILRGRAPGDAPGGGIRPICRLPRKTESRLDSLETVALSLTRGLAESAVRPSRWAALLSEFATVFRAHTPMITWAHIPTQAAHSFSYAPTIDPGWIRRYDREFARLNPLLGEVANSPGDFFASTDDSEFPSEYRESRFYREYLSPLGIEGCLAWTVFPTPHWVGQLFLGHGLEREPITEAEQELGVHLFPAVRRALRALWEMGSDPKRGSSVPAGPYRGPDIVAPAS